MSFNRRTVDLVMAIVLVMGMILAAQGSGVAARFAQSGFGRSLASMLSASQEAVEELDRETKAIGAMIRERQMEEPGPAGENFLWPSPGFEEITSPYGLRRHPILRLEKMHSGVDIGAPEGAPVTAVGSGKVVWVKDLPAYGSIVVIDHGGQVASVYAHLSVIEVQEGQELTRGSRIGKVGSSGRVTGPHLHFEIREDGEPADPLGVLEAQSQ